MTQLPSQEAYFRFQLDVLMKEIDLIDHAIGRLDELILRNRNWGTTLWAGSIALILQQKMGSQLILATAVLPLLFWIIDIRWKLAILKCSARQQKIADFLNSQALQDSFEAQKVSGINLLDPIGLELPKNSFAGFLQVMQYKDTPIFYPVQIFGAILVFLLRGPV